MYSSQTIRTKENEICLFLCDFFLLVGMCSFASSMPMKTERANQQKTYVYTTEMATDTKQSNYTKTKSQDEARQYLH